MTIAMSPADHLQCVCGSVLFGCICFPEPGVLRLTCPGCKQTHDINVSAASNLIAWNAAAGLANTVPVKADREAEPECLEPVRSGYKYESMF